MILHYSECDQCGACTPRYEQRWRANAAGRRHTCRADREASVPSLPERTTAGQVDDHGLMAIARSAVRAVLRAPSTTQLSTALDEADLLSGAMLGVARADLAWDPGKGPFAAYARLRAIGHVRDGIRGRGPLSRGEWAAGLREHDLPETRRRCMSTEALQEGGWEPASRASLSSTLESDDTIARVLAVLPPRERYVIRATVLDGFRLREAGAALGVTEGRACQLRNAGLARLREVTHLAELTDAGFLTPP